MHKETKKMTRTLEEWGKEYTYAVKACRTCLTDTPQSVLVDMKGFDYWAGRIKELTKEFREWGRHENNI